MRQWYHGKNGVQEGPVSEGELEAMLERGELGAETLVWSQGMAEWQQAHEVVGKGGANPYAPPASGAMEQADGWASGPQIRPWMRFWARMADFGCAMLLLDVALGMATALGVAGVELVSESDLLGWAARTLACVAFETACLAGFGTTLGRVCFGIRLRTSDGGHLSWLQAMVRSLRVWLFGLALGIPPLAFFTFIWSDNQLSNRGATHWDRAGGFVVSHRKLESWQWIAIGVYVVALLWLQGR